MFDHLLESSHRDESNKWSNIGFDQEIKVLALIEVNFTHLIRGSGLTSDGVSYTAAGVLQGVAGVCEPAADLVPEVSYLVAKIRDTLQGTIERVLKMRENT